MLILCHQLKNGTNKFILFKIISSYKTKKSVSACASTYVKNSSNICDLCHSSCSPGI